MASLILKKGTTSQTIYPLQKETVSIGRSDKNDIIVNDGRVSRHHAQIHVDREVITLTDLGSSNGTYVNDVQVARQVLTEDTEIRFGETIFLFTDHDETGTSPSVLVKVQPSPPQKITYQKELSSTEVDSSDQDGSGRALSAEHQLRLVLRIGRSLGSCLELSSLLPRIVDALRAGLAADRAALLLLDEHGDHFLPAAQTGGIRKGWPLDPPPDLTDRLMAGAALITKTTSDRQRSSSFLWVPLWEEGGVSGLLEVERSDEHSPFGSSDVDFAMAVAGQAASAISNARAFLTLRHRHFELVKALQSEEPFIARSPGMLKVLNMVSRAAKTDATVLLRGESGTGKELVARLLHRLSGRREAAQVCVNCAVLKETLLESELFGHEKGSFTGAVKQRIGRFELAHRGTLFLDEIAEIAPETQAKLLRVLQEGEFERVGGNQPLKVDVRVIAATNKDLEAGIVEGKFREDLYYRLKVVEITMPPLRERLEDIMPLAEHFLLQLRKKMPAGIHRISKTAQVLFESYAWPGNCRELRNVIERALVLGDGEEILVEHLPFELQQAAHRSPPTSRDVDEVDRQKVVSALKACEGNRAEAAALLGYSRSTLYNRMRKYGLVSEGNE